MVALSNGGRFETFVRGVLRGAAGYCFLCTLRTFGGLRNKQKKCCGWGVRGSKTGCKVGEK